MSIEFTHRFHKLLILLVVSFSISGIFDGLFPESEMENATIHGFFIAIMLFALCAAHSEKHNISPPGAAKLLCAVLAPIGIPYYSWKSFGFKAGSVKIALATFVGCLCVAMYLVAHYAVRAINS